MKDLRDVKNFVRVEEEVLKYKSGLRFKEIPYSEICWAYRRVEEVNGKLCCGRADFDIHYIVLHTKGNQKIKFEVPGKECAMDLLKRLEEKNPDIDTGYSKEKEDQYKAV